MIGHYNKYNDKKLNFARITKMYDSDTEQALLGKWCW